MPFSRAEIVSPEGVEAQWVRWWCWGEFWGYGAPALEPMSPTPLYKPTHIVWR
ncbi:MAG TPA: hypothetical protein VHB68_21140 [Steroidobacteraceae bacterium]|nr:hypothetical protein [Steroidobacteraceae bacterium]